MLYNSAARYMRVKADSMAREVLGHAVFLKSDSLLEAPSTTGGKLWQAFAYKSGSKGIAKGIVVVVYASTANAQRGVGLQATSYDCAPERAEYTASSKTYEKLGQSKGYARVREGEKRAVPCVICGCLAAYDAARCPECGAAIEYDE